VEIKTPEEAVNVEAEARGILHEVEHRLRDARSRLVGRSVATTYRSGPEQPLMDARNGIARALRRARDLERWHLQVVNGEVG
jgi:hypothetical protein